MKGVIFNILEAFVIETWGEETFDQIISECPLKTKDPFVGPGNYPDADFMTIGSKTAEKLKIPFHEMLKQLGRFAFPKLAKRYPDFLTSHRHPREFLKTVETIIHVEVKKIYEKAILSRFSYSEPSPNRLLIKYDSERRFCHFMEGLIEGVADWFKSPIQYRQTRCALKGDNCCEFDLVFSNP